MSGATSDARRGGLGSGARGEPWVRNKYENRMRLPFATSATVQLGVGFPLGSEGGGELGTRLDRETSRRDVPGDDSFSAVTELSDLDAVVSAASTEHSSGPDSVMNFVCMPAS